MRGGWGGYRADDVERHAERNASSATLEKAERNRHESTTNKHDVCFGVSGKHPSVITTYPHGTIGAQCVTYYGRQEYIKADTVEDDRSP